MIIRHNENLRRQERNGAPGHIITEFAQLLQFHIATYFDNELPGQPRVSNLEGYLLHASYGYQYMFTYQSSLLEYSGDSALRKAY
jgi:hypothetical protein